MGRSSGNMLNGEVDRYTAVTVGAQLITIVSFDGVQVDFIHTCGVPILSDARTQWALRM